MTGSFSTQVRALLDESYSIAIRDPVNIVFEDIEYQRSNQT